MTCESRFQAAGPRDSEVGQLRAHGKQKKSLATSHPPHFLAYLAFAHDKLPLWAGTGCFLHFTSRGKRTSTAAHLQSQAATYHFGRSNTCTYLPSFGIFVNSEALCANNTPSHVADLPHRPVNQVKTTSPLNSRPSLDPHFSISRLPSNANRYEATPTSLSHL